ncbi:hypothetical protein SPLA10_PHROGS00019 [Salmonella phage SPLA10]|nr:hypothetical protein SPLA10_PHROGS00019 [Salmonella phage SPLA10]
MIETMLGNGAQVGEAGKVKLLALMGSVWGRTDVAGQGAIPNPDVPMRDFGGIYFDGVLNPITPWLDIPTLDQEQDHTFEFVYFLDTLNTRRDIGYFGQGWPVWFLSWIENGGMTGNIPGYGFPYLALPQWKTGLHQMTMMIKDNVCHIGLDGHWLAKYPDMRIFFKGVNRVQVGKSSGNYGCFIKYLRTYQGAKYDPNKDYPGDIMYSLDNSVID